MKINIPVWYQSQSQDCLPEIDWLQFQKLSNYTPTQRLEIAIAFNEDLIRDSGQNLEVSVLAGSQLGRK